MKIISFLSLGFILVCISCTSSNEPFKPSEFTGTPKGTETLEVDSGSLPTYPTAVTFELVDFKLDSKQDTVSATYKVKGLLDKLLDAWGETPDYGNDFLVTLDNSHPSSPKILIGQSTKFRYDDNPLPDYIFYGETSNSSGNNVFDFYKLDELSTNTFSIKDHTIKMRINHVGWIRKSNYFGSEGELYLEYDFK